MFDPRQRAKHARRAMGLLSPETRAAAQQLARDHAKQDTPALSLVGNAKALAQQPDMADACRQAAQAGDRGMRPDDVAAALTALYLEASLGCESLRESYTEQMAAISVPVLKRAVGMMQFRALHKMETRSGQSDDLRIPAQVWQTIYLPIARSLLASLADMKLDEELAGPGSRTVVPFAWSPLRDSLQQSLSFVLLGGSGSGSARGLLYSRFARYAIRKGLAAIVPFQTFFCPTCRRRLTRPSGSPTCRDCGCELVAEIKPQCLCVGYLARCRWVSDDDGTICYAPPEDELAESGSNDRSAPPKEEQPAEGETDEEQSTESEPQEVQQCE